MLCLSRTVGQSILIGDSCEVRVLRIEGDKVRLGIEADKAVPVDRREVRESKMREKK